MGKTMLNSFEEKLCLVLMWLLIIANFYSCFKINDYRSKIEEQEVIITKLREQNKELENQNTDILSEILKNLQ